jgi:tetrahydromethanopterin S-methyltransferase subunit F
MISKAAAQPMGRDSVAMVWTLVARSVGLTAGVAIVLLAIAALLSLP